MEDAHEWVAGSVRAVAPLMMSGVVGTGVSVDMGVRDGGLGDALNLNVNVNDHVGQGCSLECLESLKVDSMVAV